MKKIMLLTAVLFIVTTVHATALLSEDWESGSDNWTFANQAQINTSAGNPDNCLYFGDTSGIPATASHNSFRATYSSGMTISTDVWLLGGSGDWTDIYFGLYDTNPHERFVEMTFNKKYNLVSCNLISTSSDHSDNFTFSDGYNSNVWNSVKIEIRPDQLVEFYVNNSIVWTSTKTVDPAYNGDAKFSYSGYAYGGPAYVDNLVITPEPATLALFGLGGLLLRKRKA